MPLRTVVITGGNAGLGYACAAELVASKQGEPWFLILACRHPERSNAAVEKLTEVAGSPGRVVAMPLDLASFDTVRSFTRSLTAQVKSGAVPSLHGLVCNAGVQTGTKRFSTKEGFEMTLGVNHLGHFVLVEDLLPILVSPARVLIVSSATHDPKEKSGLPAPAWNDTASLFRGELGAAAAADKPFGRGQRLYTTSKLANLYFTYELSRHLPPGVTANAFDPGLMPGTGLVREAPAPIRFAAMHVMPHIIPLLRRVMTPNVHTVEESGASLARLLTDPDLKETTGQYFQGRQMIRSSEESYDRERARKLWQVSEALAAQN